MFSSLNCTFFTFQPTVTWCYSSDFSTLKAQKGKILKREPLLKGYGKPAFFWARSSKKEWQTDHQSWKIFLYQKNSSILLLWDPGLGRKMRDKIKDARNTYSPSTRTVALSMYWMTSTSILTLAWRLAITSMSSWWARFVTSVKRKINLWKKNTLNYISMLFKTGSDTKWITFINLQQKM